MDHTEFIVELKSILSPDFINKIIPLTDKKAVKNLTVKSGLYKDVRHVKGYHLNFNTPTNIFYWNLIKTEIERLYLFYKAKFPRISSDKINQIDLLKYTVGGNYKNHIDYFSSTARSLSVIMNLNNNYEGGDLIFTDQKNNEIKRLKLNKGSVVFFPSNFMYPHSIQPITKGTRYSIVAWLQ